MRVINEKLFSLCFLVDSRVNLDFVALRFFVNNEINLEVCVCVYLFSL